MYGSSGAFATRVMGVFFSPWGFLAGRSFVVQQMGEQDSGEDGWTLPFPFLRMSDAVLSSRKLGELLISTRMINTQVHMQMPTANRLSSSEETLRASGNVPSYAIIIRSKARSSRRRAMAFKL